MVSDGSLRRSAAQLRLMMDRGMDQGNLPKLSRLFFIIDNLEEENEAARREFKRAGKTLIM